MPPRTGLGQSPASTTVAKLLEPFENEIDPLSFIAVIGMFALILFHLVVGWKVYRLSRSQAAG